MLVIAQDQGPGIADIALAMRDGYSTAHTLGAGLPGVHRLMDDFAITSELGAGTTVRSVNCGAARSSPSSARSLPTTLARPSPRSTFLTPASSGVSAGFTALLPNAWTFSTALMRRTYQRGRT